MGIVNAAAIRGAINQAAPLLAMVLPAQHKLESRNEDIVKLCETVKGILADGFQWDDLLDIFTEVAPDLIELMDDVDDLDGSEKHEFCAGALATIYFVFNPDIKGVPEFIESRAEAWAVPKLANVVVKGAFKMRERILAKLAEPDPAKEDAPSDDSAESADDQDSAGVSDESGSEGIEGSEGDATPEATDSDE